MSRCLPIRAVARPFHFHNPVSLVVQKSSLPLFPVLIFVIAFTGLGPIRQGRDRYLDEMRYKQHSSRITEILDGMEQAPLCRRPSCPRIENTGSEFYSCGKFQQPNDIRQDLGQDRDRRLIQ